MKKPNLFYIHKIANGDKEFPKKIMDIVKKELPIEISQYITSLENQNYNEAAAVVHKIKHKISIFNFSYGYEIAEIHEFNLKNGQDILRVEFENILRVLRDYINLKKSIEK